MNQETFFEKARAVRLQTKEEAYLAASQPGALPEYVAILVKSETTELRIAVLETLKHLRGRLGDQAENVYQAALSRLDRNREPSAQVRWRAIETLVALASPSLRDDPAAIAALADCLNTDPHSKVQQWAVAGLCPAAAAGHEEAIRVLRRAALNRLGDAAVRQEAAEALEDLGIATEPFLLWLQKMLSSAKQLTMAFGSEDASSQQLTWGDKCLGTIYKREGVPYLHIVYKSAPAGVLALVSFMDAQQMPVLKPTLLKQSREGFGYAEVSLSGIGKEGVNTEVIDIPSLHESETIEILKGLSAQATDADKAVLKVWAENLTNMLQPLPEIVEQMKNA